MAAALYVQTPEERSIYPVSTTVHVGCTHLLSLPQLDLQGPLHLLVLLPPPLLLLLQQDLCLPLGLLEQLQLLQLPLLFLLQLLEPLCLFLLGRLALLPLLPLLSSLLLQVLVQGLLSLCLQPDGCLDGWRGRAGSVGTCRGHGAAGEGAWGGHGPSVHSWRCRVSEALIS